jgi:hypothetical protein
METNTKENNQQQSTKNVASFLYGVIVFATAGLVTKMAWNLGLASLFPGKVPVINYGHAITWLTMLYIAARVISAGFMAEVENTVASFVDQLERFVEITQDLIDVANSRTTKNDIDDSDLN